MKKTLFGLLTLVAALYFSSCSKLYYQVCTTKACDPAIFSSNTDRHIYEDENIKITYDMWADKGNRGFSVYNKTDEYIELSGYNSCLASTIIGSTGEWAFGDLENYGTVPPHTNRLIKADEPISKYVFLSEGLKEKVRHSESKSFTKENTPLVFTNHINYYYYPKAGGSKVEKMIVHSFFVDRVTNYSTKDYIKLQQKYIEVYDVLDNGKWKIGQGKRQLPVNRKGYYISYIK